MKRAVIGGFIFIGGVLMFVLNRDTETMGAIVGFIGLCILGYEYFNGKN